MKQKAKTIFLYIVDILAINAAFYIALYLRFEGNIDPQYLKVYLNNMIYLTLIKVAVFSYFKLYKSLWKYASIEEFLQVIVAAVVSNTGVLSYLFIKQTPLPRSVYIIVTMIDIFLIGGIRISYRMLRLLTESELRLSKHSKRVMIIGAGDAGAMIIRELKNHRQLNSIPVAVIDDDIKKEGTRINGVPILGQRYDIMSVAIKKKIDEIIIAIPSASQKEIREIVNECKRTKAKVRIVPGMYELIGGEITIQQVRDVQIEDLLGRDEVKLNTNEISDYIMGKKVLVTGGGGSIGSELCRQIVKYHPSELIVLDIYENNAYDLQNELKRKYEHINLKVIIASVRDKERIDQVIRDVRPHIIFHAAAHKHVPLMEDNPREAIKNNVFGTLHLVQAADQYEVQRFVMISTDKAVNPTNIMGATKRLCEMIIQSMDKQSKTEFVAVRFGNVLGSNGSVIPLFKTQIAQGGPVTVTHPEIIRYFMTIPEAAQLVLQAGGMAAGGEIFVLDMGEPVKILNLAEDLIKLSGLEPYEDIEIQFTGLRPGEKLFEELLLDEEGMKNTKHQKIFIGKPLSIDYKLLLNNLQILKDMIHTGSDQEIKNYVAKIVPTYVQENGLINHQFCQQLASEEVSVTISKP